MNAENACQTKKRSKDEIQIFPFAQGRIDALTKKAFNELNINTSGCVRVLVILTQTSRRVLLLVDSYRQ